MIFTKGFLNFFVRHGRTACIASSSHENTGKDFPRRLPRSNSICGSDFYLAPEVIKQEEYGREIDVWSIGIIA